MFKLRSINLLAVLIGCVSVMLSASDPSVRHAQRDAQRQAEMLSSQSTRQQHRVARGTHVSSRSSQAPAFECTLPAPAFSSTNIKFPGTILTIGGSYWQGAAGDVNGDGKSDYVTIGEHWDCATSTFVEQPLLFLGSSAGLSGSGTPLSIPGTRADFAVLGDVNGDHKDDALVVSGSNVYLLISNGDGTFQPAVTVYSSFSNGDSLYITDLDGDGKADIVVTSGSSVNWLKGDGTGAFAAPATVTVTASVYDTHLVDVTGDGKLDLIGDDDSGNIVVVPGNGDGTFDSASTKTSAFALSNNGYFDPGNISFGDLNGDGKTDFVFALRNSETVQIYLNNGDGTFTLGSEVYAGFYPEATQIADMNGDGKNDILVSTSDGAGVVVLLNKGGASFDPATISYAAGGYPYVAPVVGDFDGDGKLDVVLDTDALGSIYMHGNGDGTLSTSVDDYSPARQDSTGKFVEYWGWGMDQGDFNKDGKMDFAVAQCCSSHGINIPQMVIFTSNGDGTFTPAAYNDPTVGANHYGYYVASGDFNGDGNLDVVYNDYNGQVLTFLNKGDGTFNAPIVQSVGARGEQIIAGDFNKDGKLDIATVEGTLVAVNFGNGDGTFQQAVDYTLPVYSYALRTADLNGDGFLDLVAAGDTTGSSVNVLINNHDGTFAPAVSYPGNNNSNDLTLADVNGDGKLDIITADEGSGATEGITVMLGNGDGTFGPATTYQATLQDTQEDNPYPGFVKVGDVDGDGKMDIVYTNSEYGSVAILYGKGDGTFFSPVESPSGGYASDLELADVNGDGALDVVVTGDDYAGIGVGLNPGGNRLQLASSVNPSVLGQAVTFSATVAPTVHGVETVPSGAVQFREGTTVLGSGNLVNGVAQITVSTFAFGPHSITATYAGDANFIAGAQATLNQGVNSNPVPAITSISPTHIVAGGSDLVVTVSGHDFVSGITASWNGTGRSATFVSSTQVKVTITAADLATAGSGTIVVHNPAPGGGDSNSMGFAIDTKPLPGAGFSASISATPVVVSQGQTATYDVDVTFGGKAQQLTVKCLNLPAGATCSYDNTSKKLSISTSASTPRGQYVVTVVFTILKSSALWVPTALATLLPIGMLASGKLRRRKLVIFAAIAMVAVLVLAGCGQSGNFFNSLQTQTVGQDAQSSSDAMLTVQ